MVDRLVEAGAVARVTGGYVIARVVLDDENPLNVPHHSSHSQSDRSDGGDTRAPARTHAREAGTCKACHRSIPLDTVGFIRPHYPDGELGNAKWGVDPCMGSASRPLPEGIA
jgi:hypothetical protein